LTTIFFRSLLDFLFAVLIPANDYAPQTVNGGRLEKWLRGQPGWVGHLLANATGQYVRVRFYLKLKVQRRSSGETQRSSLKEDITK
jgi:hypothetical protein